MSELRNLKQRVWKTNRELPQLGLVVQAFGNVSGIDRERGLVAIKPSGVPYSDLKVDDIVVVDLNNNVIEGRLKPSSDTKTHTHLYRHFPEIGGIVHTHSTYAVAWAQALKPVPILGTTHADFLPTEIPCTELMTDEMIEGDYEEETGKQIVSAFQTRTVLDIPMVLVGGHGPFAWGDSPEQALHNGHILEELAKMAFLTLQINPGTQPLKKSLVDKHYLRKHGPDAYYGQK
ncbi:MAG TPA: L-ribulose-5-phosphate 4-epimerase [Bacteroidota bacterium]|nr:L-ribulose-5-phosphate 4-epimerase [Bacteroidota bacterium]